MIVWLASYPRSGNTFLRLTLRRLYGAPTTSVYDESSDDAHARAIAALTGARTIDTSLAAMAADASVHFVKTHELPPDARPALYVVRDGRDALTSFARFQMAFVPEALGHAEPPSVHDVLRRLVSDDTSFGGWSANVLAWLGRGAPTSVIRFDDLVRDPAQTVARALAALTLDLTPLRDSSLPSFSELHALVPDFFREGRTGAWRDVMSEPLHDLFWERHGEAMRAAGYER